MRSTFLVILALLLPTASRAAGSGPPSIDDLIRHLGDEQFESRQEARSLLPARLRELETRQDAAGLGAALNALKKVRIEHDDLESRTAAAEILASFQGGGAIVERMDLPGPARGLIPFFDKAIVWGGTGQTVWTMRVDSDGHTEDPVTLSGLPGMPAGLQAMDGKILAYGNLRQSGWVSFLNDDGKPAWTRDDLPGFVSLHRDAGDTILVGGHCGGANTEGNGWIGRLKGSDGTLLWKDAGFPGPVTALDTLPEGVVAAGSFRRSGWIRLLSHDGKPLWSSDRLAAPVSFLKKFPEGICVGGVGNRTGWTALFGLDGKEKWSVAGLPEWLVGLASPPEGILTGGADKHTGGVQLVGMDGKLAWKTRLPGYPTCSLVIPGGPGGILVSGGERKSGGWEGGGWAQFLSVKDGSRLWEIRKIFESAAPVLALRDTGDGVLAWGYANKTGCAAFFDRKGNLLWNRTLPGTISAAAPLSPHRWIACGAMTENPDPDLKSKSEAGWLGLYRLRDAGN